MCVPDLLWEKSPSLPLNKIKIPFLPKITRKDHFLLSTHTKPFTHHITSHIHTIHTYVDVFLCSTKGEGEELMAVDLLYCCCERRAPLLTFTGSLTCQPDMYPSVCSPCSPHWIRFVCANVKALVNMILVKHNKFKHPLWGIIYGIRYFHEAEDARDKARSRVFVVVCRYVLHLPWAE